VSLAPLNPDVVTIDKAPFRDVAIHLELHEDFLGHRQLGTRKLKFRETTFSFLYRNSFVVVRITFIEKFSGLSKDSASSISDGRVPIIGLAVTIRSGSVPARVSISSVTIIFPTIGNTTVMMIVINLGAVSDSPVDGLSVPSAASHPAGISPVIPAVLTSNIRLAGSVAPLVLKVSVVFAIPTSNSGITSSSISTSRFVLSSLANALHALHTSVKFIETSFT
jgi:hypothetical protein